MKLVVALALAPVASALVAPSTPAASKTVLADAKSDLVDLQNSIPGPPGFYDPLGLSDMSFALGMQGNADGGVGQEATIGWLRHSEIKHGRIAMAAFLGFIAQCTPLVSGEHKFLPYRGYVAGCTPQEQWDNIPLYGKLQIFVLVGMLESYGEGASQPDGYVHYMRGGKPGFYPEIKGKGGPGGHFLLNLWDPFGFTTKRTAEQKERGLKCEILNGRAAMLGIMGMLSASTVRSRRPAVVAGFFSILRPFGPSRETAMLRAGAGLGPLPVGHRGLPAVRGQRDGPLLERLHAHVDGLERLSTRSREVSHIGDLVRPRVHC